ncbi:hypothetical protein F383_23167 [Gossypium arboreum]|uniref:Uncharacterized protein n=1 Tax=Gossypium arboreum TaxID=29729 RepID=A0A0B0NZ82_GOSAR|nr:hypothetical protein F383_23167 [Gossypium arboreum]
MDKIGYIHITLAFVCCN